MTATPRPRPAAAPARQRGAALLVAMILLLLVLMLAVAGMRTITLEARIAANLLESQRLHEVADGTLREGERLIERHGLPLRPCAAGASSPVDRSQPTRPKPCYVAEARSDTDRLNTTFGESDDLSAPAAGFANPYGHWYPRYIDTVCPKGMSATAALDAPATGCTDFYELNAQATLQDTADTPPCGPEALCLRSTVNLFIK